MWSHKLIGLLLVGGCFLFAILYLPKFSVYLLLSLLILGLLLFCFVHICGRFITAELLHESASVMVGVPFTGTILLHNAAYLPVGNVRLTLHVENETLMETSQIQLYTSIPKRSDCTQLFEITPLHCGKLRMELTAVRSYDWLQLFSHRIRCHSAVQFTMSLPCVPPPPQNNTLQAKFDEGAAILPTLEPAEFLGLREYQDGDRVRSIHWKLSSRSNVPIVRQYGIIEPTAFTVALVYALLPENTGDHLEAMLTALSALFQAANAANRSVRLLVYTSAGCVHLSVPSNAPNECFRLLLESPPESNPEAGKAMRDEIESHYDISLFDTISGIIMQRETDHIVLQSDRVAETVYQTVCEAIR